MDPEELVKVCNVLNPGNKPGRLTIIVRMGAEKMREKFPALIRAVRNAGVIVTWVSDPMHGNTIKAPNGYKTRPFDAIRVQILCYAASLLPFSSCQSSTSFLFFYFSFPIIWSLP
jgi:3-deoxy-7-phosphoheptulonate synthase